MNSLPVALAIAGGLILAAVIAHGQWRGRQGRPRQADEEGAVITSTSADTPTLSGLAGFSERREPGDFSDDAFGFDLGAACSGFLFALTTGASFVEAGRYKKVIVVGVDKMSSIIDYTDRATCIIFGDGAGAVLLEPSADEDGFQDAILKSDGIGREYLHIKAGEKVCITGSEGSGKSSFLKLLTGMWPDYRGNLLFNDVPFKSMVPDTLFKQVGLYFNEDELFSGTLLNNLTLGSSDINFTELQFVCDLVGLSDFIGSKQEGYAVKLDPQGKKLSYNIAQKILLARCIYQKPALLLLEDGWLGIDSLSKTKIIDYLTAKENKTTLITITEDEYFTKKCSRIINLSKGTIN